MNLWELFLNWIRPAPCVIAHELVLKSEAKMSALDMRRKVTISSIIHIAAKEPTQ